MSAIQYLMAGVMSVSVGEAVVICVVVVLALKLRKRS